MNVVLGRADKMKLTGKTIVTSFILQLINKDKRCEMHFNFESHKKFKPVILDIILCTNTVAPHYVLTPLLLIVHIHSCSSVYTSTVAPHYARSVLLLIMYEHRCSLLSTKSAPFHHVRRVLFFIMYEHRCS